MLPRHLKSAVLAHHRASRARLTIALRAHSPSTSLLVSSSHFHSSARWGNGELPRSPFQTFVEVLKDELRKNRELQENVKQLQGDVDKFQDSEAMKKARAAYERARVRNLSVLPVAAEILSPHWSS
jgi:mitochondrial import inner membrane translocase subunit TIM44